MSEEENKEGQNEETKSKKSVKIINLENCDFTSKKAPRLNSPRSIEALLQNGLNERDLYKITEKQYCERYPESKFLPKHLIKERYDHLEENRKKLIDECIFTRSEIISKENKKKNQSRISIESRDKTKNNNKNEEEIEIRQMSQTHHSKPIYTLDNIDINDENYSTALKIEKQKLEEKKRREEINLKILINLEYDLEVARIASDKKIKEEKKREKEEFEEKLKRDREVVKQNIERDKKKKEEKRKQILEENEKIKKDQMELEAKMKKIEQKVDDEKLKTLAHYNEMKEIREKKHNEAQRRKEEKIQQKIEKVEIKKRKQKN